MRAYLELLVALVKLLAPIIPFTCEEAWGHFPSRGDEAGSVHLALLPDVDEEALEVAEAVGTPWCSTMKVQAETISPSPAMIWARLLELRQRGLIEVESLRNAGVKNPLDAEAVFTHAAADAASGAFLEMYLPELEDLLGVGHARVESAEDMHGDEPIAVGVEDARKKYPRCARSWKRRPDVGSDADHPDLSARDAAVMKALAES